MQSFQEQDYTKRFDLSLWRKLIKVAKPYHKNLIAVVLFMAVSAIIDVIMPNMNAYAIDVFIANHSTAGLVGFVVAYALLTAVQVATIFGFLRQCGIVETGTCYLIRKLGFQKLQELPFSYYDRMPVGYLMSRLTNDTQRLADTIGWSLVDLCWGAVYLVACAVRMLTINWRLGLIVMLVLPPLAVISWKFQKAILAAYRQVRKNNSQITAGFNEGINGAKTTKTLVREELNIQEFETVSASMRSASIRAATLSNLFLPIVVSLGSLATAYALWQGGNSVIGGTHVFGVAMTVGTLTMFINYTVSFFQPVRDIARIFAELQSAQAAAERVISLLETEPDIVDSPEVVAQYGDNFTPKPKTGPSSSATLPSRMSPSATKRAKRCWSTSTCTSSTGRPLPLSAKPAAASPPSSTSSAASMSRRRAKSSSTARITARAVSSGFSPTSATSCSRRTFSPARLRITSATAAPMPPTRKSRKPPAWSARNPSSAT